MRGELQQRGMESNRIVVAFEHRAFEVVVENDPGSRVPGRKGFDMPTQEVGHLRVQVKAQEEAPRVREHHHEGHQWAHRAPDRDRAERTPVGLTLFSGQGAQAQIRLRDRPWPKRGYQRAEVIRRPGIAARLDHAVQARGAKAWVLRERVDDERTVRIDHRGAHDLGRHLDPGVAQCATHRGVMHAQLAGDRADRPVLGVVQAHDLRLDAARDHSSRSATQRPQAGERRQHAGAPAAMSGG